jgi:hypothetical protein
MSIDQFVFLKSRKRRLAEMVILPIAALPIGPIQRALLGKHYEVFYGCASMVLIALIFTRLSSQWTGQYGEWVTKAERIRRIVAETAETPWLNALATTAMAALTMIDLLLIIEPFDQLGENFGGPLATTLVVAAVSVLGGALVLFSGYSKKPPVVVDETPPSGHFWSELRSALPLTYAAYALAAVAAYLVAVQLGGSTQSAAFIVVFLAISQLPLMIRRRAGKRIYPTELATNLSRQIVAGVLLWGVPMGMMFSAGIALDPIRSPAELAVKIPIVFGFSLIGGVAIGVLVYFNSCLSERKAL